jgi:DNA recombination protein RmuC
MVIVMNMILILCFGLLAGGIAVWLLKRSDYENLKKRLADQETQCAGIVQELTSERERRIIAERDIVSERELGAQKLILLDEAKNKLQDAFSALSSEALRNNNQQFLDLAGAALEKFQAQARGDLSMKEKAIENLVKPLADNLAKYEEQIRSIEKERKGDYSAITTQINSLMETQVQLKDETGRLVKALKRPEVRGQWGELQLKKAVELAGMLEYCDFNVQQSTECDNGLQRPDMIVHLPGGGIVVIDAKTPLDAYLEAINEPDEDIRNNYLKTHSRQVREHIQKLSRKEYWKQFKHSPDFVVLFLPGEAFYNAALQESPSLLEEAVRNKVVLAAPTTFIALLKVIAFGWRQEKLADNAQHICELGKELYSRIITLGGHLETLGRSLRKSVDSYNDTVKSVETRVMVSARRFNSLGVDSGSTPELLDSLDVQPRQLNIPEMQKDET